MIKRRNQRSNKFYDKINVQLANQLDDVVRYALWFKLMSHLIDELKYLLWVQLNKFNEKT